MNRRVKGHISSSSSRPSSPPALPVTAQAAHLDLLEKAWRRADRAEVGLAWGGLEGGKQGGQQWPDTGGMCSSTDRATVCPKSEGSAACEGKPSQPFIICIQVSFYLCTSPSPSGVLCKKDPLLCNQFLTCRSILQQQQGYRVEQVGVYANLINKGFPFPRWKSRIR